jgi:hypothetical protein
LIASLNWNGLSCASAAVRFYSQEINSFKNQHSSKDFLIFKPLNEIYRGLHFARKFLFHNLWEQKSPIDPYYPSENQQRILQSQSTNPIALREEKKNTELLNSKHHYELTLQILPFEKSLPQRLPFTSSEIKSTNQPLKQSID